MLRIPRGDWQAKARLRSERAQLGSPTMNPMEISPEQFRRLSERVIEIAADYLEGMDARAITADGDGVEVERVFRTALPETALPEEAIRGLVDVARYSRAQ